MAKTEMIKTWAIRAVALSLLGLSVWSYVAIQTDWLKPNPPAKPSPPRLYSIERDWSTPKGRGMVIFVDRKYRLYEHEKELKERLLSDLAGERNFVVMIFDDVYAAHAVRDELDGEDSDMKPAAIEHHCLGMFWRKEKAGSHWTESVSVKSVLGRVRP